MVMYLNAYVHFSQFSGFCADFRINFAQIFASVKTYVKNRGSHESSYRSSKQFEFSAKISAERTNEFFRQILRRNVNTHWDPRLCNRSARKSTQHVVNSYSNSLQKLKKKKKTILRYIVYGLRKTGLKVLQILVGSNSEFKRRLTNAIHTLFAIL